MAKASAIENVATDDGLEKGQARNFTDEEPSDPRPPRARRYGVAAIVAILIFLTIGLSVGLTQSRSDASSQSQNETESGPSHNTTGNQQNETNGSNGTNNQESETVEEVYNSSLGPLNTTIPLFGSSITNLYRSREELSTGLTKVAMFLANNVIKRNLHIPGYENVALPGRFGVDAEFGAPAPGAPDGEAAGGSSPIGNTDDISSYETNVQEKGVEEADYVKSDGRFVYAAYGSKLVVWSVVSGDILVEVQMPSIRELDETEPSGSTTKSVPYYHQATRIESLLLTSNYLVVIVSGYGPWFQEGLGLPPILLGYKSTHVRVYDVSSLSRTVEPEIHFIGSRTVNGVFKEMRAVGDNVHIVSTSDIETYHPLIQHLERYQDIFADLADEQYSIAAAVHAEQVVIPAFVERLVDEIFLGGFQPRLARISMWQTHSSGTDAESIMFPNGIVTSMAHVTSFNVRNQVTVNDELAVSVSGVFLPSSWLQVYATPTLLVVAAQAWNYSPWRQASVETTYLVGFNLLTDETEPAAVGHVEGYLLNPFSLDHVVRDNQSYLRVATTIQNWWIAQPFVDFEGETFVTQLELPRTENQVLILSIPGVVRNETAVMKEISSIENLGKEGEVFTALRFMDDIGFAVTFERTDPFYVLDLDVHNPRVLGQIDNITGFSRYMHPINDDNSLIVAVGKEATPEGFELGLQITLFDVTDNTMPRDLHRYAVEMDMDAHSYSEAEFDHHAFRYISLDTDTDHRGLVIIPATIYNWGDAKGYFDGFFVFSVSAQLGISKLYNVSHVEEGFQENCYHWHQFPGRSMVFSGDLMTLKGRVVKSTDLGSGENLWDRQMDCLEY